MSRRFVPNVSQSTSNICIILYTNESRGSKEGREKGGEEGGRERRISSDETHLVAL